jgi:hypothetical protein
MIYKLLTILTLLLTSCGPTVLVPMQPNIVVREEVYAKSIRNMQKVKEITLDAATEWNSVKVADNTLTRISTNTYKVALEENPNTGADYGVYLWPIFEDDEYQMGWRDSWAWYYKGTLPNIEEFISECFETRFATHYQARDILSLSEDYDRVLKDALSYPKEFIAREFTDVGLNTYRFRSPVTITSITDFFNDAQMADLYLEELEDRLARRKNELINTKVKLTKYRIEGKNITKLLAKETNLEESIKMLNIKIKNHKSKNDE